MNKQVIYNPFTEKDSTIDPYGRTAKKIYKFLIEGGSEPDTILPQNLNYSGGRFSKVKTVVDNSDVRRITYAQVGDDSMSYFQKVFKNYKGKTLRVGVKYVSDFDYDFEEDDNGNPILSNLGQSEKDEIVAVPSTGFSGWWTKWSMFLMIDSDTQLFGPQNKSLQPSFQSQMVIYPHDKVGSDNISQFFLDGVSHCVFTPINDWAELKEIESKSKSAKKKYSAIKNKIKKYVIQYDKGVPNDDFSDICNRLQIGIEIDLPSTMNNKTTFISVVSQKKPLKIFRYINTRLNHIELNKVNTKDNYTEVSKKELVALKNKLIEEGEFILWKDSKVGIQQINTLERIYKLTEEEGYNKIVNEFENANNLRDFKIEHFANEELSNFLLANTHCNQSIKFNDVEEDLNHIDIRKAYTQGSECSQFQGYLGKITDFRKTSKIVGLGIYMIKNIKFDKITKINAEIYRLCLNCNSCGDEVNIGILDKYRDTIIEKYPLYKYDYHDMSFKDGCEAVEKMKILYEDNAYPSPELEYYLSLGITFDIVCGCWGTRTDIDFSYERIEEKACAEYSGIGWTSDDEEEWEDRGTGQGMYEKEDGVSHYSKWYGCCMKLTTKERYSFNCENIDYAKLNSYADDNVDIRYNDYEHCGIMEYQKKKAYHSAHIAAFISSYCRITMIEQLTKFYDFNSVTAVVVDGIYYKGDVEVDSLFSDKEKKSLSCIECDQYCQESYAHEPQDLPEFRNNVLLELHSGAGGCGKTHYNLTDGGLVDVLFVAPSWKLARNKRKEYGVDSYTFYHLLDSDPDNWKKIYRTYSTIIIDEVSMLSNEAKTKIINRYDKHKIIFCGDIGYQLPPIHGDEFKRDGIVEVEHNTNYRCKCDKLEGVLNKLRKSIGNGVEIFNSNQSKYFGIDVIEASNINYTVEDLIITATHKSKDVYTDKYSNLEKYTVLENSRDYSNGEIIIGPKPEKVQCELRHAYTVHSIQGETATHKLFIDMNRMTGIRMFYTSISRAKYLSQIVFIRGVTPKAKKVSKHDIRRKNNASIDTLEILDCRMFNENSSLYYVK